MPKVLAQTTHFRTLEFAARPGAEEYEAQLAEGWVVYTPSYARFVPGGVSGFDHWVHEQTFAKHGCNIN